MQWKQYVPRRARRIGSKVLNGIRRYRETPQWKLVERGYHALPHWSGPPSDKVPPPNALAQFFDQRREGPGIWKWIHYFEVYDEYFRNFRGKDVNIMEIGIYSGGSLDMWRDYFGPGAHVYGVDIEPSCKVYERENISILIGDQSDRSFWSRVKRSIPKLDIILDDGSHQSEHQIITLEEMVPHLRPGGVFMCEDVHGSLNDFQNYMFGLARKLNENLRAESNENDNENRMVCPPTSFQRAVASISFHPYVVVLQLADAPIGELRAPKHGTQWQPYLS